MFQALTRRVAAVGLLSAALVSTAHAWGFEGHRMIAALAEPLLTPKAQAEVQRLLAQEPGATLSSVATWADEIRSPVSGPWHYVNFPRDAHCHYEKARDCPDGSCVVEALQAQVDLLKSKASDAERLVALKYVVHLVGDVHQPLHAGYRDDKGGNTFQVQLMGQGRNLHSLWDTGMLMNFPGGVPALREEIRAQLPTQVAAQPPAAVTWAEESCQIVEAPDFYPSSHTIDERYLAAHQAAMKARLGMAALRLAAVLNGALD